jgi:hypothetical protein
MLGRRWSWLFEGVVLVFVWKYWGRPWKASVGITCNPVEVRNGYVPNTATTVSWIMSRIPAYSKLNSHHQEVIPRIGRVPEKTVWKAYLNVVRTSKD